jgi:mono/diheme cytochrome c family protein
MSAPPSDSAPSGRPMSDDELLTSHEHLLEKRPDDKAHYRLLPLVMLFVFSGLILFAATYLNRYSGHFASTVFNENLLPSTGAAAAKKIDPVVFGKAIFNTPPNCVTCHQTTGLGIPGTFPPLDGSEFVDGPADRMISIVLYGLQGTVHVKGQAFNAAAMPAFGQVAGSGFNFSDEKIAAVLTYVRQAWSNKASPITPEQVAAVRNKDGNHSAWSEAEVLQIK